MDITGKIIAVLEERGGTSARTGSPWRLASYVLETAEQYPRKMMFEVFGEDRIRQFNIQQGQVYTVSFDVDAHEYNGRWYNTIRAWRVMPGEVAPVAGPEPVAPTAAPFTAPAAAVPTAATDPFTAESTEDSGLPF